MPKKNTEKILVTGATGQISSELSVEPRKKYGQKNIVITGRTKKI